MNIPKVKAIIRRLQVKFKGCTNLDIKMVLKIGAGLIFIGILFLLYHFYTLATARQETIKQLENTVSEKNLIIQKLNSEIQIKISDIQKINSKYSKIEKNYKIKISNLLDTITKNEKDLKKLEEQINKEINQVILNISDNTNLIPEQDK